MPYDNATAVPGANMSAARQATEVESRMRALADQVDRVDNLAHQMRSRFEPALTPEYPEPPRPEVDKLRAADQPRSMLSGQIEVLTQRLIAITDHLQQTLNRSEL